MGLNVFEKVGSLFVRVIYRNGAWPEVKPFSVLVLISMLYIGFCMWDRQIFTKIKKSQGPKVT